MKKQENNIIKCTGPCGLEKEANSDNFYWRNDKNGWRKDCKKCFSERRKKRYLNNKEKENKACKEYYENNKQKISEVNKQYREDNLEKILEGNRKRYAENRTEILSKQSEYNKEHRDRINKRKRKNYAENPEYKLRHTVSVRINKMLKRNKGSKLDKSISDYLDYTFGVLISNIESKFDWWMTWKNQGIYNPKTWKDDDPSTWTWQLDHIIPQADLPYDSMSHPNFKKCWALDNLRPLSAKQNILDGTSRVRHKKDKDPKCQ